MAVFRNEHIIRPEIDVHDAIFMERSESKGL